jgi:hypothetical protein
LARFCNAERPDVDVPVLDEPEVVGDVADGMLLIGVGSSDVRLET